MGRWLAPQLPGPQRWILHDRDADLLALAAADVPARPPTGRRRRRDPAVRHHAARPRRPRRRDPDHRVRAARPADGGRAGGPGRASAPARAARCCSTLSVAGRVELAPADPLDARVARRLQRPPAPRDGARPPARPRCRRRRRRGRSAARRRGPRPAEPVAARRRRGRARRGVAHRLGRRRVRAGARARRRAPIATAPPRWARPEPGRLAATVDHADLLVLP